MPSVSVSNSPRLTANVNNRKTVRMAIRILLATFVDVRNCEGATFSDPVNGAKLSCLEALAFLACRRSTHADVFLFEETLDPQPRRHGSGFPGRHIVVS
jgi:hypothetical protein